MTTLSARALELADALHRLAHQVAQHDQQLGSQAILLAARVGLLQPAALDLERQLRTAHRTAAELAADATEEAALPQSCAATLAAMETRHRRARTIAAILGPVLASNQGPAA